MIPDDYGENEIVPLISLQPTLKIEAVDFPLEKRLFKTDHLLTKYAQLRLDKFILNPYSTKESKCQAWFKLMLTPFKVEHIKSYGHFGILWNPFKPRVIKLMIELPICNFSIEDQMYVLHGRLVLSVTNCKF